HSAAPEQRAEDRDGQRDPAPRERALLTTQRHGVDALVHRDVGVQRRTIATALDHLGRRRRRDDGAVGHHALLALDDDPHEFAAAPLVDHRLLRRQRSTAGYLALGKRDEQRLGTKQFELLLALLGGRLSLGPLLFVR